MFNVQTHPVIPTDSYADSHGQVNAQLKGGEHRIPALADLFEQLGGFTEPWTDADGYYAKRRQGLGGQSIMRNIVATLYAAGEFDEVPIPPPPTGMVGYWTAINDCITYGLTTSGTLGRTLPGSTESEGEFYSKRYWQNGLTPETSGPFIMEHFSRYRLTQNHAVGLDPQRLWTEYEKSLARVALATFNDRPAAVATAKAAYSTWLQETIPGPGTPEAPASTPGYITINPRKVLYQATRSNDYLVQGNVDGAAKACDGVAWLLGDTNAPCQSLYAAYSMQTQPLYENDWRSVLDLPIIYPPSSGGIGIAGGAR